MVLLQSTSSRYTTRMDICSTLSFLHCRTYVPTSLAVKLWKIAFDTLSESSRPSVRFGASLSSSESVLATGLKVLKRMRPESGNSGELNKAQSLPAKCLNLESIWSIAVPVEIGHCKSSTLDQDTRYVHIVTSFSNVSPN